MIKYILLFFGFVLGIGLIVFGFNTWGQTPAEGCDVYLELFEEDTGIEIGEAIALQEDCNDDITLGWATMISGIVLVIGIVIMGIIALIYDGTRSVVNHNQNVPLGDSPRLPKE